MSEFKTKTWEQYEQGQAFKRRIGLEAEALRNERFYRGEQWNDAREGRLPKPVFNLVRRITDYLVGAVAGGNLSVTYVDDSVVTSRSAKAEAALKRGIGLLNRHVAYRWEKCHMDRLTCRLLLDAALSGDGVAYCYWDTAMDGSGDYGGDIRTVSWNNTDLYAADMNRADIQSQDYLILAGRESVHRLREEARRAGLSARECEKIRPDASADFGERKAGMPELDGAEEAKATVLLKFWKQDGVVWFEKSTKEVVLRRVQTAQRLYPIAYFNWIPTRNSFHGTSPVSSMIPNQCFINRAYAMVMKHMTDTAFSKVVYDKSRIPEWSNEVGEAIAAMGGNLGDAVQVIGTGQMQDGYMALIDSAIAVTKEMMGATDTVLGSAQASNTSAILALQEASKVSLQQVSVAYLQCIEDLAAIWADMLCAYCDDARKLPYMENGERKLSGIDFSALRSCLLRTKVEIGNIARYSASGTQSMLEKLLDGGHITLEQYLEMLPTGLLPMRERLLEQLKDHGGEVAAHANE